MNARIIMTLVAKDVALFFRNRYFALVSILGIFAYVAIYFVMPRSVDETLKIGLYAPTVPRLLSGQLEGEGLQIELAESEEALKEALLEGEYQVGIVLSADSVQKMMAGQVGQIIVYFTSDLPEELQDSYAILLQELAFMISGQSLNIEVSEQVLGRDMAGMQIALRERMVPLFAIFLIMVETMGLASLLSSEIEAGTIQALLVTPLRLEGLFLGKGITGVGMAFIQAVLFMAVTGGLSQRPLLILVTLLSGALLVTGIGFLIAAVGKGMLSVMAWGMMTLLTLSIPAFSVMFPGAASGWIRVVPSFYLVDTVHQVVNYAAGWGDAWPNLLALLGFATVFVGLGLVILRRKLR